MFLESKCVTGSIQFQCQAQKVPGGHDLRGHSLILIHLGSGVALDLPHRSYVKNAFISDSVPWGESWQPWVKN